MKDKPTLEDLFQSKKLDLPKEEFWDGFQDRVKGQTMAALSQQNRMVKVRNLGLYSMVPVLVLLFVSSHFFSVEISKSSSDSSSVGAVSTSTLEAELLLNSIGEDVSLQKEAAIQLARLDSFESFANSRLISAGGHTNFNVSELQASGNTVSSQQFTF
jgi:hypothetical protein